MVIEIFTSYFGNLNRIPNNIVPVTICGKCPAFYTDYHYRKLAPKYNTWKKYLSFML